MAESEIAMQDVCTVRLYDEDMKLKLEMVNGKVVYRRNETLHRIKRAFCRYVFECFDKY